MRRRTPRSYVRQMPRIYGSLQPAERPAPFRVAGVFLRILLTLVVLAGAAYAMFLSPLFRVTNVQVEGAAFSSPEVVRAAVPLGVNIWRLPTRDIERAALANPVVDSADVLRGLPHSVRVVVHERPPGALWVSGGTVSVLDVRGIAFEQYPAATPPDPATALGAVLAKEPRVVDTKALPVATGQPVVSPSFISFVTGCQGQLASLLPQLTVDHYEVADTTYDVTLVTKQGMTVQFDALGDPGVEVRNLSRLVTEKKVPLTAKVNLTIDRWAYVQQ